VKKTRVVPGVRTLIKRDQAGANLLLAADLIELVLRLDAAVFTDAQENDAIDGHLHRKIQLSFIFNQRFITQGNVLCQLRAPAFNFGQECIVHPGGALFGRVICCVLVKSAFLDGLGREDAGNLIPALKVLVVSHIHHPCCSRAVGRVRLVAAVIHRKLFKIS